MLTNNNRNDNLSKIIVRLIYKKKINNIKFLGILTYFIKI